MSRAPLSQRTGQRNVALIRVLRLLRLLREPHELSELRTLLGYGREIGPAGAFYCAVIEDVLRRADQAAIQQDLPAMIRIYAEMQEIEE